MSFSVKSIEKGFLATFEGSLKVEGIQACDDVLRSHYRQQDMEFFIYDFRRADLSQLTLDDCSEVGIQDLVREGEYKSIKGALITEDEEAVDICQQYIKYVEFMGINWDIRVKPDLQQAFEWLMD